jgi:hypothetical protein
MMSQFAAMSTPSDGQGITPRSVLFSGVQGTSKETANTQGKFHNVIDETRSADLYTEDEDEELLDDEGDMTFDPGISLCRFTRKQTS